MGKKKNKQKEIIKVKELLSKIKKVEEINIKEIPFKLKEIQEKNKEESDLEKEVSKDNIIFSPSIEENTSPTLRESDNIQELPRQLTQFQKEDQSNFSQSISYSQNTYQIRNQSQQRSYQSQNNSGNRPQNTQQEQLMRPVQTNITERQSQNSLLISKNNLLIQERESINDPIISKELEHEQQSRYDYKSGNTDLIPKRKRVDMF